MTTYPRQDTPPHLKWWIGCDNWRRLTPKQQTLVRELKKFNRPFRVGWSVGSVHPSIEILTTLQQP